MSIETYIKRICKDTAVYWGSPAFSSAGHPTFADPVEVECFWNAKIQLFRDDSGRETASRAEVFVTQDLDDHGMLYHGTLDDLTTAQKDDPRKVSTAYEIRRFIKKPSLHLSDNYMRKALL